MNQEDELVGWDELDIYEEMHRLVAMNPWAWQSIGAVSGLLGGVLSPACGTLLIAVTWFVHSEGVVSTLDVLSIVSFVLTIPLLAFGAHCLDLLERKTASRAVIDEQQPSSDARQGNRPRLKLTGASVALAIMLLMPAPAEAQQTIFNVPSVDVLDKGSVYGELDVALSRIAIRVVQ